MRVGVLTTNNYATGAWLGSTAFTTGGTWQRYSVSYTEASGGGNRFLIAYTETAATLLPFSVDGAQVEVGSVTTQIDGDEPGCYWLGAPHASQSARSGTYRGGGSVVALADLGLRVDQALGIGMMPLENTSLSFALTDGAEYQHTRAKERPFTLTAYVGGTTQRDYHITRRTILNALKIDVVDPQQPLRLWYVGGEGTIAIDAVLDAGMEGAQKISQTGFGENAAIRFIAYDPYWHATTDEGTTLAARVSIGSANWIAKRAPNGQWGTLGAAGVTVNNQVQCLAVGTDNTLFLSGIFTTVGGTSRPYLGQYDPTTNLFGTLAGGTANSFVRVIAVNSQGSLYIGGTFNQLGGTTVGYIGLWNGAAFSTFGSMSGDANTADGVKTLAWNRYGTMFIGGDFTKANGTAAFYAALYGPGGPMGTLIGVSGASTITGNVYTMAVGLDDTLYIGGIFGSAGGTGQINNIAFWRSNALGRMGSGADSVGVFSLATMPDGRIAVGGQHTYIGSVYAPGAAIWNGVQYQPMGSGLTNTTQVFKIRPMADGQMIVGGAFTRSGSIALPDPETRWNGYTFLPLDIDLQNVGQINDVVVGYDQTLYVAGSFTGTAQAAQVASLVNTGMADAYPVIKTRLAAASGTGRLYQILNTTLGVGIFLDYALLPGEEITLITEPGKRSLQSSFMGNIFGRIIPGSNITALRLLPGTNTVSIFGDNDNLTTSIFWRARSQSADGGTAI